MAVLALAAAACSTPVGPEVDPDPTEDPVISTVALSSPLGDLLAVGSSMTLGVEVLDGTGASVSGAALAWDSDDAAVASVSASGVVTGEGQGRTTIRATTEGVSGTFEVTVADADLGQMSALLNDTFMDELIGAVGGSEGAALQATFDACAGGLDDGNLGIVLECIGSARDDLAAASDPADGPIGALIGLFVDGLERFLNYPVLTAD